MKATIPCQVCWQGRGWMKWSRSNEELKSSCRFAPEMPTTGNHEKRELAEEAGVEPTKPVL